MIFILLNTKYAGNEDATSGAGTAYLPEYQIPPQDFSEVCVIRSLVVYVCFLDRCLTCCTFSFVHCVL